MGGRRPQGVREDEKIRPRNRRVRGKGIETEKRETAENRRKKTDSNGKRSPRETLAGAPWGRAKFPPEKPTGEFWNLVDFY